MIFKFFPIIILACRIYSIPSRMPYRSTSNLAPVAPDPSAIVSLILKTENQKSLIDSINSITQWTPDLVQTILKRLWNHAPKALLFFRILENHHSYTHSAVAFDYAIDIAARMQDYKSVWSIVRWMQSRKLGPTPKTFFIITGRYVSVGKAHKAVKIFLSMHKYGCQQDLSAFNALLDALCKSMQVEMAHKLLMDFRDRFKADVISYNVIANGYCLKKQMSPALDVLKEMVERGLDPTLITYNILLKGYFRTGRVHDAWKFFLQMKKRKVEIDVVSYTTVVHGFGIGGDVRKARRVFYEMIGAGVVPSVATYNAFIQCLCKKDSVENAIVVFEEMLGKGYLPNTTTYIVIIKGLCSAGKTDIAVEYMDKMRGECEPVLQTYNVVIRYYCKDGEIDKALHIFEKMSGGTCLPNVDTYNILIGAMFVRKKSDDLVVAGKLLIEMINRGFVPQKFTFNRVLNGLLLTGNQGFAREILRLESKCGGLPRNFRL